MALEGVSSAINAKRCVCKLISLSSITTTIFDIFDKKMFSMGTLAVTVRQAQSWTDVTVAEVLHTLLGKCSYTLKSDA